MAKVHWKPNAKPAFPDMVTPFAFLIAVTKQLAVTDLILAIWRGLLSVGYHWTSRPLSTRQVSRAPPSTVWYCKHLDEVERPCQTLQLKFFINVIGTITFFFFVRDHSTEIDYSFFSWFLQLRWSGGFLTCPGTRWWFSFVKVLSELRLQVKVTSGPSDLYLQLSHVTDIRWPLFWHVDEGILMTRKHVVTIHSDWFRRVMSTGSQGFLDSLK